MTSEKFVITPKNSSLFVSDELLDNKNEIEEQLQDENPIDEYANTYGLKQCDIKIVNSDFAIVGFLKKLSFSNTKIVVAISAMTDYACTLVKQVKDNNIRLSFKAGDFEHSSRVKNVKITDIQNQLCTLKLIFEVFD